MPRGRSVRWFCAVLLCLSAFSMTIAAFAAKPRCPAVKDNVRLSGVSVFDGPPEEQADLVPDISRGRNIVVYAVWEVGHVYDEGRNIFLVCRYGDSDDTVTVQVETRVDRCFYRAVGRGAAEVNCR